MRKPSYFSPAEWEVLQYIMRHHPVTVRQTADHFAETHGWARTTVLTLMDRLLAKGYLTRSKVDNVHHYVLSQPKSELMVGLVRDFIQKALGGSVSPFVAYLGQEGELSQEERVEIRRLIEELDAQDAREERSDE